MKKSQTNIENINIHLASKRSLYTFIAFNEPNGCELANVEWEYKASASAELDSA